MERRNFIFFISCYWLLLCHPAHAPGTGRDTVYLRHFDHLAWTWKSSFYSKLRFGGTSDLHDCRRNLGHQWIEITFCQRIDENQWKDQDEWIEPPTQGYVRNNWRNRGKLSQRHFLKWKKKLGEGKREAGRSFCEEQLEATETVLEIKHLIGKVETIKWKAKRS